MLFKLTYDRAAGPEFEDDHFTVPEQANSDEEAKYWAMPKEGPPSVKRAVQKALELCRQHITKLNEKNKTLLETRLEIVAPEARLKQGPWVMLAKNKDCKLWSQPPKNVKQASYDFRR